MTRPEIPRSMQEGGVMHPGFHARTDPDKPAVIMADRGRSLSYRRLDDHSARMAQLLYDRGLRRGDVIALLTENCERGFEVYWAALRSGLLVVPIDCSLSLEEIAYIINDSGARALLVSGVLRESAGALRPLTPHVEARFVFDGEAAEHEAYEAALSYVGPGLAGWSTGAEMFYSAGVTGRPKGVTPASREQRGRVGAAVSSVCGLGPDTVYFSPTPVSDPIALLGFAAVHAAGGVAVTTASQSPEAALRAIERYRATIVHLVPAMLTRIFELPSPVRRSYDVSSLRAVVHSSEPCPPEVKRLMIDWWGPIVHEFYGSAEVSLFTVIDTEQWLRRPGSVGRSVQGVIHVCDDAGDELPRRTVGQVYLEHGDNPFRYHNLPHLTAAARHPAHPSWVSVGDLGYLDEDDYLYLTDRKASLITIGGVAVYPREVSDVLALHPKVADAAVIGIQDAESGEQVKAVVQVRPGVGHGPTVERELLDYIRARVGASKTPQGVDFVHALPRTASGKLITRRLLPRYAAVDSTA